MSKLDLGEILANNNPFQNVPNSGTGREQIEYIDIALIDSDPNNFYELSDIDQLAANIELCGLQQPIRVRNNPDDPNRVIIVSGHRRRAAIEKLVQEGREDLKEIPCIREQRTGSAALQELQLIYANSDTRRMTSADIMKQVERVQDLLYQLKEEGIEFPGRMRDHVAEACKISKSKISRLKVIRDKLNPIWQPAFEAGKLNESAAYSLAQLLQEHQQVIYLQKEKLGDPAAMVYEYQVSKMGERLAALDALTCPKDGVPCSNCNKHAKITNAGAYEYVPCIKCCSDCQQLAHCKAACPKMADRVAVLKEDEKERRKREKLTQEQIEQPIKERIQALWVRFGEARLAANKSWDDCCRAVNIGCWAHGGEEGVAAKESGDGKVDANTCLPYGYNSHLSDVRNFVNIADLLGCSLDYLLCRTDDSRGFAPTPEPQPTGQLMIAGWMPGGTTPAEPCNVVADFDANGIKLRLLAYWDGAAFLFGKNKAAIDAACIKWMRLPPDEEAD